MSTPTFELNKYQKPALRDLVWLRTRNNNVIYDSIRSLRENRINASQFVMQFNTISVSKDFNRVASDPIKFKKSVEAQLRAIYNQLTPLASMLTPDERITIDIVEKAYKNIPIAGPSGPDIPIGIPIVDITNEEFREFPDIAHNSTYYRFRLYVEGPYENCKEFAILKIIEKMENREIPQFFQIYCKEYFVDEFNSESTFGQAKDRNNSANPYTPALLRRVLSELMDRIYNRAINSLIFKSMLIKISWIIFSQPYRSE